MSSYKMALNRVKDDLTNVLYNAQSLRDSPFANDTERQDKTYELTAEISRLLENLKEFIRVDQMCDAQFLGEINGTYKKS